VIAVSTSSLQLPLIGQDKDTGIGNYDPLVLREDNESKELPNTGNTSVSTASVSATSTSAVRVEESDPSFGNNGDIAIEIDDDDGSPQSRSKEDFFHQFQDLPIKKEEPARSIVSELLILASFQMNRTHLDDLKVHLATEYNIIDVDDLMKHFIHNKEYWRQHVPMPSSAVFQPMISTCFSRRN
jgi:hypothetical protein